eukprot:TRINITY_DN3176_c3_g7_i1.p2 TRINITY_DN3176_c3_g7~~TRINITY_DN3176_c3_g7_i1.p2  ORF type:complete len:417 (-),score=145.93 TRINITY_DN3176_c3_g7_i1:2433-3647(-)
MAKGKKLCFNSADRFKNEMARLAKDNVNKKCFDCRVPGTNNFITDLGIFVCANCAARHRDVNHHVKGIDFAQFTKEDVDKAKEVGNERANDLYFRNFNYNSDKLPNFNQPKEVKRFFEQKYIEKKWAAAVVVGATTTTQKKIEKMPPNNNGINSPKETKDTSSGFDFFDNDSSPTINNKKTEQSFDFFDDSENKTNKVERHEKNVIVDDFFSSETKADNFFDNFDNIEKVEKKPVVAVQNKKPEVNSFFSAAVEQKNEVKNDFFGDDDVSNFVQSKKVEDTFDDLFDAIQPTSYSQPATTYSLFDNSQTKVQQNEFSMDDMFSSNSPSQQQVQKQQPVQRTNQVHNLFNSNVAVKTVDPFSELIGTSKTKQQPKNSFVSNTAKNNSPFKQNTVVDPFAELDELL